MVQATLIFAKETTKEEETSSTRTRVTLIFAKEAMHMEQLWRSEPGLGAWGRFMSIKLGSICPYKLVAPWLSRPARDSATVEDVSFPQWSDLPPDLLGSVVTRLPTAADCASFRAVCRSW